MKLEFTKIFSNLGLIVNFAKSKSKKERASKYENSSGSIERSTLHSITQSRIQAFFKFVQPLKSYFFR